MVDLCFTGQAWKRIGVCCAVLLFSQTLLAQSAESDSSSEQIEPAASAPAQPAATPAATPAAAPSAAQPAATAAPAQPLGSKTLTIREKGTGIVIKRVEVKVGDDISYTDPKGQVTIELPGGDAKVRIYRSGFEVQELTQKEVLDWPDEDLFLFPATPLDNEVVIRGARRPEVSRKVVSVKEARKVAPSADPAQVPKLLPGVQSDQFSSQVVVRGSGPSDTRYYVDDWTVPFIFHQIGNISIIPDQLLTDVEFSSGGFGPQYGNATGGIINLRTKTEVPERPLTEFRINVPLFSGVYHERPLSEDSWMAISGRRSYIEAILPQVLPEESNVTVTPYFGDAHLYYVQNRDDGYLKVLAFNSFDGLKLVFDSELAESDDGRAGIQTRTETNTIGTEWKKILNRKWSMTLNNQIGLTTLRFSILSNRFRLKNYDYNIRNEFTKRIGKKEKIYLGWEVENSWATVSVLAPQPNFNDPFFDFEEAPKVKTEVSDYYYTFGTWAAYDWRLGSLLLTPGLRFFRDGGVRRVGLDPRLNGRYDLSKENRIKFALGQYSQRPEFRDFSEDFGNPQLNFIKSNHYVLGIETDYGPRWTTEFQVYHKQNYDLVRTNARTNASNYGSGFSNGFEVFIRRNETERLFGWLAYTYQMTRERDRIQDTFYVSEFDQTHIVNLVGNYRITATWDVGGRIKYNTGDPYTRVDDAVYNSNLDKYQPRQDPDAKVNNDRLQDFYSVNLYATKDFLFDTWKMGLRFGVENLAHEPQPLGIEYNYDYSEERPFEGLPPIPYIEIRGEL